jgi:hypothetical protein
MMLAILGNRYRRFPPFVKRYAKRKQIPLSSVIPGELLDGDRRGLNVLQESESGPSGRPSALLFFSRFDLF